MATWPKFSFLATSTWPKLNFSKTTWPEYGWHEKSTWPQFGWSQTSTSACLLIPVTPDKIVNVNLWNKNGGMENLGELGPNHVSVILSRRRDSITSVWYYVSRRRDTSFLATVTHRNFMSNIIWREKNYQFFFEIFKLSHLCDTITSLWYFR